MWALYMNVVKYDMSVLWKKKKKKLGHVWANDGALLFRSKLVTAAILLSLFLLDFLYSSVNTQQSQAVALSVFCHSQHCL